MVVTCFTYISISLSTQTWKYYIYCVALTCGFVPMESYISNIEYTGQGKFGTLFVGVDST